LKHPGARSTAFLDSLETNLQEAYDEVGQWIGINTEAEAAIPFKLSEIVDVQLVSTALSAANKLNVKTECYINVEGKRTPKAFLINKLYLNAFQELVHNLLTNAFKYSGKQLRTEVHLRLTADRKSCILSCTNDFTLERAAINIESYAQTCRYAEAPAGRQANLDQLSGFQKIRSAFSKFDGCRVDIRIVAPTSRARVFTVHVKLEGLTDLISNETYDSDR
jgi:hypothetical protein